HADFHRQAAAIVYPSFDAALSYYVILFVIVRRPQSSPPFPYTTLFRSPLRQQPLEATGPVALKPIHVIGPHLIDDDDDDEFQSEDRKSTRLNSSHLGNSYAVFCSKTKTCCPADAEIPPCRSVLRPRWKG